MVQSTTNGHVWDYEHIGRKIAVHIVAEAGRIAAAEAVPIGFVVGMTAVRIVAGHTAEAVVVGSIGSVVLALDTET